MKPVIILKLGGSILTHKSTGGGIRKAFVRRVVREITFVYKRFSSRFSLVILHGAGSLGHPLVHEYNLLDAPFFSKTIFGFSRVTASVETLTDFFIHSMQEAGIPAVGFQTRLCFHKDARGSIFFRCAPLLSSVLDSGGIPIMGGDLVLDETGCIRVLSADVIAVFLAREFSCSKILFATNVAGVYPLFPPLKGLRPFVRMSRTHLEDFLSSRARDVASARDVTGGMIGKLSALPSLSGCDVVVFDGRKPENISALLRGESIFGTTISF